MATVEGAASDLVKTAKANPIVTAAVVGATGGMIAGAAGVLPGAVIGAASAIAVERVVKG
jgi:outer membrane lipoprotein SlyB